MARRRNGHDRGARRGVGVKAVLVCGMPMISASQWTEAHDGVSSAPVWRNMAGNCLDLTKNRMYIYGGIASSTTYGDLWYFDLSANTWTELNDGTVSSPTVRSVHSMVLDTTNDRLYIFGGQGGPSWHHRNDVWYLDVAAATWTQAHGGSGTAPDTRYRHAAMMDNTRQRMYVFGGYHWFTSQLNDMWYFDIVSNTWTEAHDGTGTAPSIRGSTVMILDTSRDRAWIWGGWGGSNDVWYYDLGSNTWTQAHDGTGTAPPSTASYVAGMGASNNLIYIYGGSMDPDQLWYFDIQTLSWTQVTDGTGTGIPAARAWGKGPGMGGVTHSPLRLYFYGGSGYNDVWYYTLPTVASPSPSPSPASVVGDPVSYFRGKRWEFSLPPCMSLLLKVPDMELWGQPFYGLMGEQWIEHLSVRAGGAEVASIKIKRDIVLHQVSPPPQGSFATLHLTIPEIDPEPLPLIPQPCDFVHSTGIGLVCNQARYLPGLKGLGAPPREAVVVYGQFVHLIITSSSAFEYYMNGPLAAQHAHLDIDFLYMKNESSFSGLLPEVWGLRPLSEATARLMK